MIEEVRKLENYLKSLDTDKIIVNLNIGAAMRSMEAFEFETPIQNDETNLFHTGFLNSDNNKIHVYVDTNMNMMGDTIIVNDKQISLKDKIDLNIFEIM